MAVELQVSSLSKAFAGERVVSDLSFAVSEGEVVSAAGAGVASFVGRSNLIAVRVEAESGAQMRLTLPNQRTYGTG